MIDLNKFLKVRPLRNDEKNFVYSSWLKSVRVTSDWSKIKPDQVFFREYQKLIKSRLETSSVLVATPASEQNILIAYLCYQFVNDCLILDFIYVKGSFRRNGIAQYLIEHVTRLLNPANTIMTHYSSKFNFQYDPFLFLSEGKVCPQKKQEGKICEPEQMSV